MAQYLVARLDHSFAALSDATRRGVLERLGRADASITELAGKFHMTLTGMKKHVGVLERAGLVTTKKIGRVRTCQLGPRRPGERTAGRGRARRRWAAARAPPGRGARGGADGGAGGVPPALGRALRRVGHGRRGADTKGDAR